MVGEFSKFIDTYCIECAHCSIKTLIRQERTFCFELYENDKEKFENYVYPKLRKNGFWPVAISKETNMFKDVFCLSTICTVSAADDGKVGDNCDHYYECLDDFIDTSVHIKCKSRIPVSSLSNDTFFNKPTKQLSRKKQRKEERRLKFAKLAEERKKSRKAAKKPKVEPKPVMISGGSGAWQELIKTME